MNELILPTELEVEMQAASIFPDNKELQSNFMLAVYYTIYYFVD